MMKVTSVAILGAGNGGITAAADLAERGFDVRLYELPQFAKNLKVIKEKGGILLQEPNENNREVFCKVNTVTTDIQEAIEGAQIIMLTIPGFGIEAFTEVLAPVVTEEQVIFFNGADAMCSMRFVNKAKAMGIHKAFKVCESNSLSYGTRGFADEARSELTLRVKKLFLAALPKENTQECLDACKQIYDCFVAADNVWHAELENGNPEVHPGPCVCNAGRIDFSGGEFWLYKEGITEHTVRVLRAVERERMAIGKAFGFDLEDAVQSRARRGYFASEDGDLQTLFNTSEVFTKIKGPVSVTARYFTEDISDGLVLWADMAKVANVPCPTIEAVISMGDALLERDFRREGLTLEKLGLSGKSVQELLTVV